MLPDKEDNCGVLMGPDYENLDFNGLYRLLQEATKHGSDNNSEVRKKLLSSILLKIDPQVFSGDMRLFNKLAEICSTCYKLGYDEEWLLFNKKRDAVFEIWRQGK